MKKDKLWSIGLSLALLSAQAFGAIYKWQDANGQIHYDQIPPDNVNATQIKPDVKPSSSAKTENDQTLIQDLNKQDEKVIEDNKKAEQEAQIANERALNCQRAKTYLGELESKVRIRLQNSSGVSQLTPEQRTDEINKTKEAIQRFCNSPKPVSPQ